MKTKVIIQGSADGYVANYNEKEQSCEWVRQPKNAHAFNSMVEAVKAVGLLELDHVEYILYRPTA